MKNSRLKDSLLGTGVCALILLIAMLFQDGGYLHEESAAFLLNYLDERPFFEKIFNPAVNDWGMYQCRELSYFFDWIDARFIAFCRRIGFLHFFSCSAFLLVSAAVFVQQYWGRVAFPKLPSRWFTFASLLFVLAPAANEMIYFRSAKYLTAFGITLATFRAAAFLQKKNREGENEKFPLSIAAALLLLVLSDRQGFFLAASFAGVCGVLLGVTPRKERVTASRLGQLAATGVGAVAGGVLCNLLLMPALISLATGAPPDFSYQRGVSPGLKLFGDGALFVFGNLGNSFFALPLPWAVAAGGALVAAGLLSLLLRKRMAEAGIVFLAVTALVLCGGLMASRHPMFLRPEVLFGTYFLPGLALCLFLLLLTVSGIRRGSMAVDALLLAALIVQSASLAEPSEVPADSPHAPYRNKTPELRYALEFPDSDYRGKCLPRRYERVILFFRGHRENGGAAPGEAESRP